MPNLEYLIRPYQSPSPFGTIIIPSTPSGGESRATLTWGATAQGTMPVPVPKPPGTTFQCCKEHLQENNRSSHTHRIIGSDGESYVDVDRPYQMKLKKSTTNDCSDSLDQISVVSQEINEVISELSDAFTEAASKFGPVDDCNTQWNLSG
jgi:hypothetical protein